MTPKSEGSAAYNKDDNNAKEDKVLFPDSSTFPDLPTDLLGNASSSIADNHPSNASGTTTASTPARLPGAAATSAAAQEEPPEIAAGAISWQAKLIGSASLSSCESKYMALTMAGQEASFLRQLQLQMEGNAVVPTPIRVHLDSHLALDLVNNPFRHARCKDA